MTRIVKLDDRFPDYIRIARLSDAAFRLHVHAICWSAQNAGDGAIPVEQIANIAPRRMRREQAVDELVAAELWIDEMPHGWFIPQSDSCFDYWTLGPRTDVRQAIPLEVRELVYRRDGYRCVECQSAQDLTLDHIHPWSLGGSDDPSNLRTLCRSCNSRKGARLIEVKE